MSGRSLLQHWRNKLCLLQCWSVVYCFCESMLYLSSRNVYIWTTRVYVMPSWLVFSSRCVFVQPMPNLNNFNWWYFIL